MPGRLVVEAVVGREREVPRERVGEAAEDLGAAGGAERVLADAVGDLVERRDDGAAVVAQGDVHGPAGKSDLLSGGLEDLVGRHHNTAVRLHADLELFRIALDDFRQACRVDFQQRDIGSAVRSDQLGAEFALVGELDIDLFGAVHQMGISQDVPVGADDESLA